MNKWFLVIVLVLLVLAGAMGLRNLATAGSPGAVVMANGPGPIPPSPWMNGPGPIPPSPWMNGPGPIPPSPWSR
jgi:hypothetical protein